MCDVYTLIGGFFMLMIDLLKEFEFDLKIRNYSK